MRKEKVAVIGMACRFPAANDLDTFWHNLQQGRDCISEIPQSRWDIQAFFNEKVPEANENTTYARWAATLDDFDHFDARFFNISAREARAMDPQQRLLLQETWHCIEHAGIAIHELQQRNTAVFVGAMALDYQHHLAELTQPVASHSTLGGYSSLLSNRVSWCFDFKGESLTIDTACSSSLVALHKARQSIAAGDADYAIVAGVNILCHPWKHLSFSKLRMFSPEGKCNTFDIAANGYVPGEGIGVILLTSENRCNAQGATCYGYVDSSAVNHNGKNRAITAPDVTAQTTLITQALAHAQRSVDEISYIEAHGTGTSLGDPIETEALSQAFAAKRNKCFIGSLKTHIGHLEAASGIAGVIKVLLMMSQQTLIKTRNLTQENPLIAFDKTPLTPVMENRPWLGDKVAAINSFGFGGTNAHVILSKTPQSHPPNTHALPHQQLPLLISARSKNSFKQCLQQWLDYANNPNLSCYQLCASSLNNHTTPYRAYFLAHHRQQLIQKITDFRLGDIIDTPSGLAGISIVLLAEQQFETYRTLLPGIDTIYQPWIKQWPDSTVRPVLQTLAFYQSLFRAGVTAPSLFCDKASYAVTCVLSGLITMDSLIPLINRQPVALHVPTYSIVKDDNLRLLLSPAQIKQALAELSINQETFLAIIAESRLLFVHQPTFHQALFAWHDILHAQGIALNTVMEKSVSLSLIQQSILLLAILVSLAELNKKWQLNAKHSELAPVLRLIAELVARNQLSRQNAVAIFSDHAIDKHIDDVAYLAALMTHCSTVRNIISTMIPPAAHANNTPDHLPAQPLQIQEPTLFDATQGNIIERLCELWQSGTDIAWSQLIPDIPFNAKARPLYPFDTQKYWITHSKQEPTMESSQIAIIGFSGRFPGAQNVEQLWQNLANKVCSVSEIPLSRWDAAQYWDPDPRAVNKSYSKWGGILDDIDSFDAGFFNILPADAILMDPQHRLVLEESWKTLEMAGYTGERLKNAVCGLYVGCMGNDYYEKLLTDAKREITAAEYIGNSHAILSARLAYYLDLKGPTLTVDTACSSSLVCAHLACEALRSGDADIMLAGGVTLWLTETPYISMSKASMLSPTGRCNTFDDSANGFVPGESVCFVLLKRLSNAVRDGDSIYGVITGSGINQDGKSNGISAPNLDSQHKLIERVYQRHNINPASIQYVETHGTGTRLGDPVEVTALARVFNSAGLAPRTCALGALKSNIGHTSAASGIAGMIKVLLSLREKTLVANVNFQKPNSFIDFANTPFYVLTEKQPWHSAQGPRRAALSSFGFSGTNAHMVIEETPDIPVSPLTIHRKLPFPLSARKPHLLREYQQQLAHWLENHPAARLQDISFTLSVGRHFFSERALFWADSVNHLRQQLLDPNNEKPAPAEFRQFHQQFMQCNPMNWQAFFNAMDCRIIALPGQIFDKARYWLAPRQASSGQPSQKQLTVSASHPVFSQHNVNGIPILPGTAILSFILWQQTEYPFVIRSARWLKPLTAHAQQLYLAETSSGRITVTLDPATLCFSALKQHAERLNAPTIIPVPQEQMWSEVNKSQLYHAFRRQGLSYTGAFQRIDQRCRYDNAIYTRVSRPEDSSDRLHRDASFLDGILQIVLLFNQDNQEETWIPYSVDAWTCYAPLPDQVIVRAQQKENGVDVTIADSNGQVLQTFCGINLEKISGKPKGAQNKEAAAGSKEKITLFIPQTRAVSLPDMTGNAKTLYLDSPTLPVPLHTLNDIERIVISVTDNTARTFNDTLNDYVLATFDLIKTLQSAPRQTPLSLEYRLLSQSAIDNVLMRPLSACLNITALECPMLNAKVVSSQRVYYQAQPASEAYQHTTIKKGSTWLITGGAGALGFALACELAKQYQCRLLLCGRSQPSAKHDKHIEKLHALGGHASYHCVDCADYGALAAFINSLSAPLNGVIHCAGVLNSGLIKNRSSDEINNVIAAKVAGTLNLDLLTQNQPLDFFILTSSIASLCPTAGLSDYSYGNAFLNHFAHYRALLVDSGKRHGKTLSLCWPHWNIDGMPLSPEEKEWWWLRYGFRSLSEEEGTAAFIQALVTVETPHCVIAKGNINKISASINKNEGIE